MSVLARTAHWLVRLPAQLAVLLIRGYQQVISPLFPPTCRFTPTCSSYAVTAIGRFGLFVGGWMAVKRIIRCNPWHLGGYDPVPGSDHGCCSGDDGHR